MVNSTNKKYRKTSNEILALIKGKKINAVYIYVAAFGEYFQITKRELKWFLLIHHHGKFKITISDAGSLFFNKPY